LAALFGSITFDQVFAKHKYRYVALDDDLQDDEEQNDEAFLSTREQQFAMGMALAQAEAQYESTKKKLHHRSKNAYDDMERAIDEEAEEQDWLDKEIKQQLGEAGGEEQEPATKTKKAKHHHKKGKKAHGKEAKHHHH